MILAPSLLSADFGNLEKELQTLKEAGLSWVHWDVMDGMFVPNITFGAPVIKALRKTSDLFFDVHLMVEAPERYINDFAAAGADLLVVHAEATRHLHRTISEIKRHGMRAGVALNPATPLASIENILGDIDNVLIMSVNPGFGGQSFIPQSLPKIAQLASMLEQAKSSALIQVDGGVEPANIANLYETGADVFVSGSAFFAYPPYKDRLKTFINAVQTTQRNSYRKKYLNKALEWKRKTA